MKKGACFSDEIKLWLYEISGMLFEVCSQKVYKGLCEINDYLFKSARESAF